MVDPQASPITDTFPNTQDPREDQSIIVEEPITPSTTSSNRKRKSISKDRPAALVEEINPLPHTVPYLAHEK